jgi:hypothetical protein
LLKEYAEEIKRLKEMLQNGGTIMMPAAAGGQSGMMSIMAQGIMAEVQIICYLG